MSDQESLQETSSDSTLDQLRALALQAPPTAFSRFRRRANIVQGSRMLVECQVTGFWLVLDTMLKRLFRAVPIAVPLTTADDPGTSLNPAPRTQGERA